MSAENVKTKGDAESGHRAGNKPSLMKEASAWLARRVLLAAGSVGERPFLADTTECYGSAADIPVSGFFRLAKILNLALAAACRTELARGTVAQMTTHPAVSRSFILALFPAEFLKRFSHELAP